MMERKMEVEETEILTLSAKDIENATVIFTKNELRKDRIYYIWAGVFLAFAAMGFFAVVDALFNTPTYYP
jgi:hypothetical protein